MLPLRTFESFLPARLVARALGALAVDGQWELQAMGTPASTIGRKNQNGSHR